VHTRINEIVKKSGLTKTDFAKRIGLSQSHVSRICSGETTPSDRTISDICRAFNVNRRYLEQGEEPMFLPELDPDTDFINALLENSDSPFVDVIRKILRVYVELPPEDQKKFDSFVDNLKEKITQKDRD
jgi:transcriptional regulator with XRE-family HTH domain